ncbi:GNAT family N-acetyltransferase [uncultured Thermanaerothrix sp.]|uniref:GNAT family N-acetyltransferase n=1 Tax=uncultured Thermanaerothrix sp. TaxID=1195149 RepID=UPI00261CC218|nr:GNAT family N-acetyltransferase [uncultured Thermanaerothrix sp.]
MISILPFRPEDYEEAMALWKNSPGIGLSRADSPEAIAVFLERNPGLNWIARQHERLVGTLLCGYDGRRAYLYHLAVHPDYRRQGIGRALVERCLDQLKAMKVEKAHLFVYADNQDAIAFWQATGWYSRPELIIMSFNVS